MAIDWPMVKDLISPSFRSVRAELLAMPNRSSICCPREPLLCVGEDTNVKSVDSSFLHISETVGFSIGWLLLHMGGYRNNNQFKKKHVFRHGTFKGIIKYKDK